MNMKMFVMLPMFYLTRKLDNTDPNVVFYCRVLYGVVQLFQIIGIMFIYRALRRDNPRNATLCYVPPPPNPMEAFTADPNNPPKKKYKASTYGVHLESLASKLVSSTVMGMAMTVGLHWYKGMIFGLAMQCVMGPFNFFENHLTKIFLLGATKHKVTGEEDMSVRLFDEKLASELKPDDQIVDEQGKVVATGRSLKSAGKKDKIAAAPAPPAWDDVLLNTWDAGRKADAALILKTLTLQNANDPTEDENRWTALMILSGLKNCRGWKKGMEALREHGAEADATDCDGWNALHWAAQHNHAEAARMILAPEGFDGVRKGRVYEVKDKEGKLPIDIAKEKKHEEVAKAIEEAVKEFGK